LLPREGPGALRGAVGRTARSPRPVALRLPGRGGRRVRRLRDGGCTVNQLVAYVAIGLSAGLVYGLLALGIVLVYKGSRTLNFAHPFFGLFAAFLTWWMATKASFPPFSWLPFGLVTRPRIVLCAVFALVIAGLNGYGI